MSNKFIEEFIKLPVAQVKNKLKNCSDTEIEWIADAYFLAKDGAGYNRASYLELYGGRDGIKEKLLGVEAGTLINMIKKGMEK
ncbi:TPA: hypothetical protein ACPD3F_000891 [Pasteurella multocida]|nr:hypothetical protein [Pasteurella multocida]